MPRELDDDLVTRKISIIYGHVQVGRAINWRDARKQLAESVYAFFGPCVTGIGSVAEARARHLERAATAPVERTDRFAWIWIGDPHRGGVWCAQEGDHGLRAGDLAIAHDAHEPGEYAWTVDVKCKILSVSGRHATIEITTGEAVQFSRGEVVTVGVDVLRPRPKPRQAAS